MSEKNKDIISASVDPAIKAIVDAQDNKSKFVNDLLRLAMERKRLLPSPYQEYNIVLRREVAAKIDHIAKLYGCEDGNEFINVLVDNFMALTGFSTDPKDQAKHVLFKVLKRSG